MLTLLRVSLLLSACPIRAVGKQLQRSVAGALEAAALAPALLYWPCRPAHTDGMFASILRVHERFLKLLHR